MTDIGTDQPENSKYNVSHLIRLTDMDGRSINVVSERLMHIINKIKIDEIRTVLDIGSVNATDSIDLARVFEDATIYTFEPVPANQEICQEHIDSVATDIQERIYLQRIALDNQTGPMAFWELDELAAGKRGKLNRGIGSKYQIINPDTQPWEHNVQRQITVVGYRLDDWCKEFNISRIDAIHMDVQGSELDIFNGAGSMLNNVQFIIATVGIKPRYHKHAMKADIDTYLLTQGFVEWQPARRISHEYNADVIYLNTRLANY